MKDDPTEDIVNAVVNGTWTCPECRGKPLGEVCWSCGFWDGISLQEIADKGWTAEEVRRQIRSRNSN